MIETAEKRRTKGKLLQSVLIKLAKTPLSLVAVYSAFSILLAILIVLRFSVLSSVWIVRFNVIVYFFTYYMVAVLSLMWLFLRFHNKEGTKVVDKTILFASLETLGCFTLLLLASFFTGLPEYAIFPVPVVITLVFYVVRYRPKRPKKIVAPILIAALVLSLLAPLMAASFSFDQILSYASGMQTKEDQVNYISGIVLTTISQLNLARANNNFEKLQLSGDGACGEGTMAIVTYLKKLGFDAREAGFPGEDHAFAEVKMNGTWKVIDPGYSLVLASEETRGDRRAQEAGTVTYVAAYTADGFTELTQQYVPTDTILVRVTQHGEPLSDASVTFVHTLVTDGNARSMELPGNGFSFHTDTNGTVAIRMGKIGVNVYNGSFTKTDPYYIVYINGKPTQQKVTSTGTGIVTEIPIDLTKP